MTETEQALIDYVTTQRWYGAKSRSVVHAVELDSVVLRESEPRLSLAIVELRYESGAHDLYQLLRAQHDGDTDVDGFEDPAVGHELLRAIRAGITLKGVEGSVEFTPEEELAAFDSETLAGRIVDAEQSNTSIVLGDALILKAFRRLEPGTNPELELLRFLAAHGFENIAALAGSYAYSGGQLGATLGVLQRFVAGGVDGWELALDEVAAAPELLLDRLRRLGSVTAEMHTILASDVSDPSFAPETPSVESLGLLTATIDEEIGQVFLTLPDEERLAPIAGRGEEVREQLRMLAHAGSTGKVIRTHGDYHLGQTLWADDDWVVLDFEGEPARSLTERRRKRSPLRDVAGMLRSFAYVEIAAELVRGAPAPHGWAEQAREAFLTSYLAAVDPTLLPSGQAAVERLLAVFELEKAVYELRYELDNRPDWVGIPVAGILRLIDGAGALG